MSATSGFFRSRWVAPPQDVTELDPGELAPGFEAAGVACGIKPSGRPDLGIVACSGSAVRSAGVLTSNAAAAAPVRLCRERCDLGALRAVVVNSGNANAATGGKGRDDAAWMQGATAQAVGAAPEQVAVASTGVIGMHLPMDAVRRGVLDAARERSARGGRDFATAILTTDAGPKQCTVRAQGVTLSAQAKGAGMMQPGFATLLCFVQTDAALDDPEDELRAATEASFGRITVDGQQSTNDAIFLQATGTAGLPLPDGLLDAVLLQLAVEVLADGEGATRVARVAVTGARDSEEGEQVARAVANSQLVQTAIFGRDPNWGRIVQAAGMALAGQEVHLDGRNVDSEELAGEETEVELALDLGRGEARAHVYCSDLTYDYVRINSEYTT